MSILRLWFFLLALVSVFSAEAQTFADEGKSYPRKAATKVQRPAGALNVVSDSKQDEVPVDNSTKQINDMLLQSSKAKSFSDNPLDMISEALGQKAETVVEDEDSEEDVFIPEGELYRLNTPTIDGSQRGGQAFVQVDEKGRMKKVSNIFLFYDNFNMSSYIGNTPTCNVRFNILSNLDQKINKLDVKLVWPGMTTTLSYSDVSPNTQLYYNYSLLGEGCYNMGKAPNIIVNRCRVKGMTAAECANKLVWLSK